MEGSRRDGSKQVLEDNGDRKCHSREFWRILETPKEVESGQVVSGSLLSGGFYGRGLDIREGVLEAKFSSCFWVFFGRFEEI